MDSEEDVVPTQHQEEKSEVVEEGNNVEKVQEVEETTEAVEDGNNVEDNQEVDSDEKPTNPETPETEIVVESSNNSEKKPSGPKYEFVYFKGIHGRGSAVRFLFDRAGVEFKDTQIDKETEW